MKIAVIADPIDEQYAGIYVYAREFIHALQRQHTDAEITYIHLEENDFFRGMRARIIPLKRNIPLWATFRKFFWIPWLLRREGYDVVHDLSHIAPFTFWGGGYARVVTIHDLTPVLFPQWHIFASRVVHRLIFPFLFRRADLVLADSDHTKRDILAHYRVRGRIETLHLAARTGMAPQSPDAARAALSDRYGIDRPFILYVGTLEPRKNLDFLLRLYGRLRDAGAFDGQLVLVGKKGWFNRTFEATLSGMSEAARADIVLTGYVPEADLPVFYSAARLFVYPSFYEGFGLPPLEAMQCGCPVLVARNSSLIEVVGDGGLLLDLADENAWFEAAKNVLSDPALHDKLSGSGRRQAGRFDWDAHAQKVLALYRETASVHAKTRGRNRNQ